MAKSYIETNAVTHFRSVRVHFVGGRAAEVAVHTDMLDVADVFVNIAQELVPRMPVLAQQALQCVFHLPKLCHRTLLLSALTHLISYMHTFISL